MLTSTMHAQSSTINEQEYINPLIKKVFEGLENDLLVIAKSTGKWSPKYAQKVIHDIFKFSEKNYLKSVDIMLLDIEDNPIIANKYIVGLKKRKFKGKHTEKSNWSVSKNSSLVVVINYNLSWRRLALKNKKEFMKKHNLKIGWIPSNIDTNYSHLEEN